MTDIAWSNDNCDWNAVREVRSRRKLDAQAYHMAHQLLHGTFPANGVIACPDEYSAEQLLVRVKFWIDKLRSMQT